ncbi:MAG TPA: energy transducer TonB [Pyrinomonadaceae bacterium]|nr:energy transducer TonB [Pyrinomonadaceae bacterium]
MSKRVKVRGLFLLLWLLTCALTLSARETARARVAVLDFGATEAGERTAAALASSLSSDDRLLLLDREQGRAAARGAGYAGSLNMTLEEARDLGAAIDCDFFITGDAQTLRRFPSTDPVYYEAYVAVFIVSARTGRLVMWERPSFEAENPVEAEKLLFAQLESSERRYRYGLAMIRAQEDERYARALAQSHGTPVIEDAPSDEEAEARGLRLPQPYRRLRPPYPDTAARIEAEATVDVQAEIGADGEVGRVDVVRWAGFGLDEATTETVRRLHFRPAMRGGVPVPMRVLLRYNFRKPPKQ